ncbi:hypothetical protein DV453_005044 [Geotrichum candidum]|nr:hypothetical protein DV453_005044 [Geotrichum candidum]
MVSTRRSRILILTAVTFVVCFLIFAYPRSQSPVSKFSPEIDEKTRLEPEFQAPGTNANGANSGDLSSPPGSAVKAVGGSTDGQDLSNEPGETFDAAKEYKLILRQAPVMIFSKSYCPHSKFVKDLLLNEYQINPKPFVVELDLHPHGSELQAHIGEVTGRRTVPNVHVMGQSRGGGDEFRALHQQNTLAETMEKWGGDKKISVKRLSTN